MSPIDPAQHHKLAVDLFNHVWSLLDKPVRTPAEDAEMIHAAHASRHHWGIAGSPLNFAIGEWQISRVYAVLGRAEPARYHAGVSLEWARDHDLGPFPLGCAHEALARADAAAGDRREFDRNLSAASECLGRITDSEDAKVLRDDLATLKRP